MKHDRISIDPDVMFGKPVIKGTRITVEHILRKLSVGQSVNEILTDHPHLTREDVLAATGYAADYVARERLLLRLTHHQAPRRTPATPESTKEAID